MLLPSASVLAARKELGRRVRRRELSPEQALQRMVDLDPHDGWALHGLALYWLGSGDHAKAEEYAWRAIQAHPFSHDTCLLLAELVRERDAALADGLEELGLRKLLHNPKALQEFLKEQGSSEPELGEPAPFASAQDIARRADLLARRPLQEPPAVARRLRPYRLIHELQVAERESLEPALVERILESGTECGPLLLGLLRGWGWTALGPRADFVASASLALLGEIGDPAWLPGLLEFLVLNNARLSDTASWAIARIGRRRAAETFEQFRALAPQAGATELVYMAMHLASMPPVRGAAEFLLEQLRSLDRYPKDERDAVFSALALGYLAVAWPEGGPVLEDLLLSSGAHLKPATLRSCRELIANYQNGPPVPPLCYQSTIYDICCPGSGQAIQSSQVPAAKPGRNDPCWCGSGRKYKKCHLRSDEAGASRQETPPDIGEELRRKLADFVFQALDPSEFEAAAKVCFGRKTAPAFLADEDKLHFTEWLIWDYTSKRRGRTLIEEFQSAHAGSLAPEERRMLDQWAGSCVSLYEVQQVRPGKELQLKDLLRGQTLSVRDVSASLRLVRWDCILARVLEGSPNRFAASALLVPRPMVLPFRDWVLQDCRRQGLPVEEYLRRNSHRVRRQALEMAEQGSARFDFVTAEGDTVVFSKAAYEVNDRAAVTTALESCELLARDPCDDPRVDRFTWFETPEPVEGGRRVLGSLRLESDRLVVECNSRARLRRARKLIESLAGAGIRHLADEFTPWREALAKRESESPEPQLPEIPFEHRRELITRFYQEHYRKWLDTPLPALGGKTPRQAAASPRGRQELENIVKSIENLEERKRLEGEPYFDVSILRRELGLPG